MYSERYKNHVHEQFREQFLDMIGGFELIDIKKQSKLYNNGQVKRAN